MELDLKQIQKNDPLKRMVERQTDQSELSPMEPPEAYEPPSLEGEKIDIENFHPFLKTFYEDHKLVIEKIIEFENVLAEIQEKGPGGHSGKLSDFFQFLDHNILTHNQKEEKILFPILRDKLIAKGEHSNGPEKNTAIEMLEDDHIKGIQLSALCFNFFGLSSRLPDQNSRVIVLDAAIEQGKALTEMLRLHIFREDNIIFPMADEYLTVDELDILNGKLAEFIA